MSTSYLAAPTCCKQQVDVRLSQGQILLAKTPYRPAQSFKEGRDVWIEEEEASPDSDVLREKAT